MHFPLFYLGQDKVHKLYVFQYVDLFSLFNQYLEKNLKIDFRERDIREIAKDSTNRIFSLHTLKMTLPFVLSSFSTLDSDLGSRNSSRDATYAPIFGVAMFTDSM